MPTNMTWLKDTAERTVAAFAQAALAVLGAGAVNVIDADWPSVLGVGGGAAVVAVLKALAARGIGDPNSASAVPSVAVRDTGGKHSE